MNKKKVSRENTKCIEAERGRQIIRDYSGQLEIFLVKWGTLTHFQEKWLTQEFIKKDSFIDALKTLEIKTKV